MNLAHNLAGKRMEMKSLRAKVLYDRKNRRVLSQDKKFGYLILGGS